MIIVEDDMPVEINERAREDEALEDEAVRRITPQSSLREAMEGFHQHMLVKGFAENTIKAFLGDLRILGRRIGQDRAIGSVSTWDLNDFLGWLLRGRGKPCSPKSYARRITTLKVFFSWLKEADVLQEDPSEGLVHRPVSAPLPEILDDDQVNTLLNAARDQMFAVQPDTRPYVLVSLLLQTGIKKGECMGIALSHINRSDRLAPVLEIRYRSPRNAHKERRLALSPQLLPALDQYLRQYQPKQKLFECTARNLEYVLHRVAEEAKIEGGVSFEQLRWTAAVRDYRRGMPEDQLRRKLGLSEISWRETGEKIAKLAGPAL